MLAATNQLTERAIERLQEIATQGRQKWLLSRARRPAAIALALAILFAVLIARPIRQLDQAIRRMGTADFTHAIEVNGPQDLRYLGQRLEWLRSRLHELEEQQNRFLRHVSHELKTPLTAVREGAELLRDNVGGKLSPEQREIVRIVRENTLSLQKLIEDLLTYHQTRAMEPQTVGPGAAGGRRAARAEGAQARGARAHGDVRGQSSKPALVVGDADKVRTIVDNLVSNAIKYSPRSATIAVSLGSDARLRGARRHRPRSGHRPGRARADLRFVLPGACRRSTAASRARGSGSRSRANTRLAHGGRIEVRDRADGERGAHFRLWLPLAAGDAGAAAPQRRSPRSRWREADEPPAPPARAAAVACSACCSPVARRPPPAPPAEPARRSWRRRRAVDRSRRRSEPARRSIAAPCRAVAPSSAIVADGRAAAEPQR